MEFETSQILIALATYLVATASPGPATLAIMGIAMDKGRKPAVIFASGVLAGSFIWALLALLGIAILLSTYASLLYWLKIVGGVYLLWLSYKSITKITSKETNVKNTTTSILSNKRLFIQGLALHVTNPKAIFTWVAIVSLALPQSASITLSLFVVTACMFLGVLVFGGYALLFSTLKAQAIYKKLGNWFNGILALVLVWRE
ncbi:MAG: LysE family translocator [Cocleimonas sp.]|nr:LysE family translocator [Cocleimonas sp.]